MSERCPKCGMDLSGATLDANKPRCNRCGYLLEPASGHTSALLAPKCNCCWATSGHERHSEYCAINQPALPAPAAPEGAEQTMPGEDVEQFFLLSDWPQSMGVPASEMPPALVVTSLETAFAFAEAYAASRVQVLEERLVRRNKALEKIANNSSCKYPMSMAKYLAEIAQSAIEDRFDD